MTRRPKKGGRYDELTVAEVTATFDPLPITPVPEPETRDWVLEAEAAGILGLTKRALERRRNRGTGPAWHNRYGYTAYYIEDLDAWVAIAPARYRPKAGDGPP